MSKSTTKLPALLVVLCVLQLVQNVRGQLRGGADKRHLGSSQQRDPKVWDEGFVKSLQMGTYLNHLPHTVANFNVILDMAPELNQNLQSFKAYYDGINDLTMLAKEGDACFVAFAAQRRNGIFDLIQTVNPIIKKNAFGTNCDVRQSFYNGYETNYADELRADIDTCVKSCSDDKDCPLYLSGNSVGGAIAITASVDPRLQAYNPITFAMGPLRAIINEECTDLNTNSIYRVVSSNAGFYDASADGSPKVGYHVGHTIYMDEVNEFVYLGLNNGLLRFPDNYNIHTIEVYLNRINSLSDSGVYPITLNEGYRDGHWCNYNDECLSGTCSDGSCASYSAVPALLGVGANCTEAFDGSDCESGICHRGKCALPNGLAATGSPCVEHSECSFQRCADGFCLPKVFTGNWCAEDNDCVSGSCSGPMSWVGLRTCQEPEVVVGRASIRRDDFP